MAAFTSSLNTLAKPTHLSLFFRKCTNILPCTVLSAKRNYSEIQQNKDAYDIIVVGGGLVGTTLACALGQNKYFQKRNILLLEGGKKSDYSSPEKYSNRVVALNRQSRQLLDSIGAWKHIEAVRYCPVQQMQVWDACSDAAISFDTNEGDPPLAYIIENDLIIHSVITQLQELANVDVIYSAKVQDVKLSKDKAEKATVSLATGEQYQAQLVVGADGTNSRVREAMKVDCLNRDYHEMGIVATLKLSETTENITAWQRFLPTGPIAFLPLTNSLSSLVWSLPRKEAKRLLQVSEEEFVDSINRAIWETHPKSSLTNSGTRLSNFIFEKCGLPNNGMRQLPPSITAIEEKSRAAFPLSMSFATSLCATGAVLVGDAVHKVHPLAGQGANLGFGDVISLVGKLGNSARYGFHLGDLDGLTSYERDRLVNTIPITLGIHALHDIYRTTFTPLVAARNIGVQFVNACSPLKDFLARRAYGEPIYNTKV